MGIQHVQVVERHVQSRYHRICDGEIHWKITKIKEKEKKMENSLKCRKFLLNGADVYK